MLVNNSVLLLGQPPKKQQNVQEGVSESPHSNKWVEWVLTADSRVNSILGEIALTHRPEHIAETHQVDGGDMSAFVLC